MEEKNISSIVAARGTAEGLILRLDGKSEEDVLKGAVKDFIDARKSFIEGSDVIIEWLGSLPNDDFVSKISDILVQDYKINIKGNRLKNSIVKEKIKTDTTLDSNGKENFYDKDDEEELSLFGGVDAVKDVPKSSSPRETSIKQVDSYSSNILSETMSSDIWDEANTRIICSTLRSGQKIETEHSLLILGDVNSGAEIIAGGDVVVLGTLRGVAHAGAYDESGAGRIIFALDLRPTQLRIGSVISRGGTSESNKKLPEIAHVDGDLIVVEPYNSRSWKRKG